MILKKTFDPRLFLCLIAILFGFTSKAQSLTANFSASPTAGCSPLVVAFKDLSTGNVTGWQWDFGNGGTSTLKNPSAIYFTPGNYTVTLTVTDATNATNTTVKTAFITIYTQPTVDFSVDKRTGCSPAKIKFTDKSATPAGTAITSWKWDFGDGGSSTQQNPSYTYRTPGSYTVTLSITNDKGCTQLITKPNYIDVTQGVVPSFSYVDPAVCSAPATVNFTNKSSGPGTLSYKWNFGNGKTATTFNASTLYATNGTYRISLIVSSNLGCTDSTASSLDIGKVTTDFIIPTSICPKVPVQFLNNATPRPIKAFWKFSNGTTDTLKNGLTTFAAPGNYTVTLVNTYAVCTDTLTKNITVVAAPTLDFKTSDTAKCQPSLTANFSNTSNGTTYFWDFGDSTSSTQTSPAHTYNKFGDYTVTLIATGANGCSDTLKKPAYIKIRKPVINLPGLPTQGCIPFKMNFKANVQSVDTVTSYKWDFGDGSGTSTLAQPTYIYPNKGTYTVTLTITTSSGCTETKIVNNAVKVGPKPTPDFSADVTTACADPGIQFTNLSTNATEYTWDFGDGTTSNEVNPKHVFSDIGSLDITLTAINNGCQDMISKSDFVFIKPSVSRFDYKPDCNNRLQYTFTDKSLGATSWNWDFGDGTTFVGQNPPAHSFPSLGTYDITLTTTNGGCSYSLTRTIKIADLTPTFTSKTREGCKPFTPIINPVLPNSKLITNYVWDFGDGSGLKDFGPGNNGQFTYPDAGTYNVTLITIDTFGCKHQLTKNTFINVNGPTADFTSTNNAGCKGLTTTFIDSSKTDGRNPITSWKWDFGDSTLQTYTAPPFQHTYDSVGDFDIKLVVTDSKGCSDSIFNREFVKISTLKANWQSSGQTCPNSFLGFFNQTTSDLPYTSLWNFGDGDTSTARELSHKYADTGMYTVSLKVRDMLGCEDSSIKVNSIKVGLPQADFTANNFITYCTPFEAKFSNTSTYYESSNWDLSQATSNQKNPSLYYTTAGVYPIKLIITSPGGCKDTVTKSLTVHNASDATISYDPLIGCRPIAVNLEAFSPMNGRFTWDFGDGNVVDTTINTYTHIYNDFGAFVPKVILQEPGGCLVPLSGTETIQIYGAKAKFGIANNLFCDSGYINILDSTTSRDPIAKYTWDFGDGTISNAVVPVHNYSSPGNYTVSLFVETQVGCKDTMVLNPPVKVVQSPLMTIGGDSVICVNEIINHYGVFLRTDTSAVQWVWQLANGSSSFLQNPGPLNYQAGSYLINAIATNSSGCADTATKSILVNPLPQITVTSPLTKVVGFPLTIPVNYSSNVISYQWYPANSLNCADCPQPITTTKFNTKYVISVVDSNGCVNASEVQVIVLCKGADLFVPNSFSPNNDGSNDVFYPRGRGIDRIRSLRVFNRWGQVVFEKREFPINDPSSGWDGRYNGKAPQPGVYIYQAEVLCENGELIRFDGNIALIL